jgi:hypothetical protein
MRSGRSLSFKNAEVQSKAAMLVRMGCVMNGEWRLSRRPGPHRNDKSIAAGVMIPSLQTQYAKASHQPQPAPSFYPTLAYPLGEWHDFVLHVDLVLLVWWPFRHPSPNSSPQAISKLCYPRSGWLLDGVAPSRFRD